MAIYVLDNYSVHFRPEIRQELFKRGYFLVLIGWGVIGGVQINDTDAHSPYKREYRDEESALMLRRLEVDKGKIPSASREDMVYMTMSSWEKVIHTVNFSTAFKRRFVTNAALDGSEDYLVSDHLFKLIGEEMLEFRKSLTTAKVPATLQELVRSLIPPKGVRGKNIEGAELLDYGNEEDDNNNDGDNEVEIEESDSDSETEETPESDEVWKMR